MFINFAGGENDLTGIGIGTTGNGIDLPANTTLADLQNFIAFDNSGSGFGKVVFGGINNLNIDWP